MKQNSIIPFVVSVILISFVFSFDSYGKESNSLLESRAPQTYLDKISADVMFGYSVEKQTCGVEGQIYNNDGNLNDQITDKIYQGQHLEEAYQKAIKYCLVSFEAANKLWLTDKAIFVDVRSSSEFRKGHILKSLNIPLHQIKTKTFLKNKPVVIVDDGYFMRDKVLVCARLREKGYKRVSVLDGGLLSWRKNSGELDGNYPVVNLVRVSPEQYIKSNLSKVWVIIDATKMINGVAHLFPGNEIIKYFDLSQSNKNITAASIAGSEWEKPNYLVVATSDRKFFNVEEVTKRVGAEFLFQLSGGIEGYKDYLLKQKLMLSKVRLGPVSVKPCGR